MIFNETNETSSISQKPLARSSRNHEIRVGGIDFHLWEWLLKETCPFEMNFENFFEMKSNEFEIARFDCLFNVL